MESRQALVSVRSELALAAAEDVAQHEAAEGGGVGQPALLVGVAHLAGAGACGETAMYQSDALIHYEKQESEGMRARTNRSIGAIAIETNASVYARTAIPMKAQLQQ